MKKLYFILYNQINTSFFPAQKDDIFLYIHHSWKINFNNSELQLNIRSKILDYACGYNFIEELKNKNYTAYFEISQNWYQGFEKTLKNNSDIWEIIFNTADENFVQKNLEKLAIKLEKNFCVKISWNNHKNFFLTHQEFRKKYEKPPVMENFYRFMRKKENILMNGNNPEWDKWNFDSENRKFDKNHKKSWIFDFDEENDIWLQKAKKYYNFSENLWYPTCRKQAINLLNYFVKNHLDNFWKLEDAMYQKDDFVHHSLLSQAINFWLLSPQEVVKTISRQDTQMNNKEWFIRQVLGWREYMFHFFHFYKDDIYSQNYFNFTKKLPEYFWWKNLEQIKENCVKQSISRVLQNNYGHHIERLMIIGNFSLLKNFDPQEVNRWYFEQYVDAFEWVVTPNVISMSQYADGWKLATKPYISSGNYINKMSDFCKKCEYNVKEKYSEDSCSFNYLYWNFVDEQKDTFWKTRQSFVLKNLEKIDLEKIKFQIKKSEKNTW